VFLSFSAESLAEDSAALAQNPFQAIPLGSVNMKSKLEDNNNNTCFLLIKTSMHAL
jgi:hypothetical protein